MEHLWNDNSQNKIKRDGKIHAWVLFYRYKSHTNCSGSNAGPQGEKPTSNSLVCETDQI